MSRIRIGVLGLVAAGLAATVYTAVNADVASPRPQWTPVRMESEEVNVSLGESRVEVAAVFNMRNTGKAATVKMGYPLGVMEKALNDFKVTADGEEVKNVRVEEKGDGKTPAPPRREGDGDSYRFEGPYKQWKVFDVPMTENGTKAVKVSYWVEPAKVATAEKSEVLHYVYTLLTGATWKGKIDKAVIRVKLGDVKPDSLVQATPAGFEKKDAGTTLEWTMKDFKPSSNIEITFKPTKPSEVPKNGKEPEKKDKN